MPRKTKSISDISNEINLDISAFASKIHKKLITLKRRITLGGSENHIITIEKNIENLLHIAETALKEVTDLEEDIPTKVTTNSTANKVVYSKYDGAILTTMGNNNNNNEQDSFIPIYLSGEELEQAYVARSGSISPLRMGCNLESISKALDEIKDDTN